MSGQFNRDGTIMTLSWMPPGMQIPATAYIAGTDEVGRGPLAGPVVAAAVILDPKHPIPGLNDSKKLSAARREELAHLIRAHAVSWALAECSAAEIDTLNILQASLLAMARAVAALDPIPEHVFVDGNKVPEIAIPVTAVVRGDQSIQCIAAASIIAKVARDQLMVQYDQAYPGYGFARHKGYPSRAHVEALSRLGVTPLHRRSYRPVREALGEITLAIK